MNTKSEFQCLQFKDDIIPQIKDFNNEVIGWLKFKPNQWHKVYNKNNEMFVLRYMENK